MVQAPENAQRPVCPVVVAKHTDCARRLSVFVCHTLHCDCWAATVHPYLLLPAKTKSVIPTAPYLDVALPSVTIEELGFGGVPPVLQHCCAKYDPARQLLSIAMDVSYTSHGAQGIVSRA